LCPGKEGETDDLYPPALAYCGQEGEKKHLEEKRGKIGFALRVGRKESGLKEIER